jgi:hypothetical protein
MALLQDHHIISQSLAKGDQLLRELQNFIGGSQFNVQALENRILLPATQEVAKTWGQLVG